MGSLYIKNGGIIGNLSNSGGIYDLETALNRTQGKIFLNGSSSSLASGETTIPYTGNMGYFDVDGIITLTIEAYGGAGGRGRWSTNNDAGAPGGKTSGVFKLSTGRYYYFVGEGDKSVAGTAGAGGGSTDIRTTYNNGTTFSINSFLETSSLNSRFIVAGGGGGAHGGIYGHWGDSSNKPGAGGPDRATTNSLANNDNGHVNTGANATEFGLDGGSSVDSANYTANGAYGRGGWPTNFLNEGYTPTGSTRSGWGWPNGGSGTSWAAGGGGGGWYGGATNWPNGGGGSNYMQGIQNIVELLQAVTNTGAVNSGAGYLKLIIE